MKQLYLKNKTDKFWTFEINDYENNKNEKYNINLINRPDYERINIPPALFQHELTLQTIDYRDFIKKTKFEMELAQLL